MWPFIRRREKRFNGDSGIFTLKDNNDKGSQDTNSMQIRYSPSTKHTFRQTQHPKTTHQTHLSTGNPQPHPENQTFKSPGSDENQNVLKRLFQKSPCPAHLHHQCLIIVAVIPIRKPNKPAQGIDSYRPISLTDSMNKILEKLLLRKINRHTQQHDTILPEQVGSWTKHSAELQLGRIVKTAKNNFTGTESPAWLYLILKKLTIRY